MSYWKYKEKFLLLIVGLGGCQEIYFKGVVLLSIDIQRELIQSFFMLIVCLEIILENSIERFSVVQNIYGDFRTILILRNYLKGNREVVYLLVLCEIIVQFMQGIGFEIVLYGQIFSVISFYVFLKLQI